MPHLIEIRDLKKIYAAGEEPVAALAGVSLAGATLKAGGDNNTLIDDASGEEPFPLFLADQVGMTLGTVAT